MMMANIVQSLIVMVVFSCTNAALFIETLRDLIRYLRTDSNMYIARRLIGDRNVVENDLIPLLKSKKQDEQMFDIILRFDL